MSGLKNVTLTRSTLLCSTIACLMYQVTDCSCFVARYGYIGVVLVAPTAIFERFHHSQSALLSYYIVPKKGKRRRKSNSMMVYVLLWVYHEYIF